MAIKEILIVGGGTSGWMSAVYLAKQLGLDRGAGPKITLVEASDVPTVGVGEGTFPSIKTTLHRMGISETDFIRGADATFKQGIRFNNWLKNPAEDPGDYYQHLFDNAHIMQHEHSLAPYWAKGLNGDKPYSESVTLQHENCERELGPKVSGDKAYFGGFQYAYHLDAGKFAQFLKSKAAELGVTHIVGHVDAVHLTQAGDIKSVQLKDGRELSADLFIDCSGFAGLLISQVSDEEPVNIRDTLFVDRAVTVRIGYDTEQAPIPSTTLTTAQTCGWIWDIGLSKRRGIGYVYSSAHSSDEEAAAVLSKYTGRADSDFKRIKMKTGYRRKAWVKNCVSVGLAGGFLEPLEATGIIFIESALWLLVQYFPKNGQVDALSRQFNLALVTRYENAVSFLKMHYCLSQRTDSEFWADNRRPDSIPEDLQEKLAIWKHRFPHRFDFNGGHETFIADSYAYVLLGMDAVPNIDEDDEAFPHTDMAKRHFQLLRQASKEATAAMMPHRDLIDGIHAGRVSFA